jgi:hypothetical protein
MSVSGLKADNLISFVFTGATVLLLLLLLALLVLYRAYRTSLQRLFLYLVTATALRNIVSTLNVQLQFEFHPEFCESVGFCSVWTTNVLDLMNFGFTMFLISTAYQRLKGKRAQCLGCCRRHPVLTEILCVITVVLLPLTYLWEPALHHIFGLGVIDCWVERLDENCQLLKEYNLTITIIDVIDLVLRLANILSFLMLMVIISILMTKLRQKRAETVGRAVFLILMVGLSTSITIAFLVIDMGENFTGLVIKESHYRAINSCGYVLADLFVILGVAAYLYSPGKLGIKSLRRALRKWKCCERFKHHHGMIRMRQANTNPSGVIDDDELVSVETSIERDIPSYTTALTAPYTDGFTDITEIVKSHRALKYGTMSA